MVDRASKGHLKSWTETERCLYLMRPGSAVTSGYVLNDYNRPLSRSGINDVLAQIERFRLSEIIRPDCILCSTALRSKQTVELLSSVFSGIPVFPKDALYLAPAFRIMDTLSELDIIFRRVMIVTHHSGLNQLLAYLAEPKTIAQAFRPADCATVRLPERTDWHTLQPGIGFVDCFFSA